MSIFHPDIEFETNLEMSVCKARLENAGASVWTAKNFITRRDTNRLGFLWYEKRGLKSLLLQGPALLGDVIPRGDYQLVKADFRPYLAWKPFLFAILLALILSLAQDFSTQREIQVNRYVWVWILMIVGGSIQLGFYFMVKNGWKRLSARLREMLMDQGREESGRISSQ